MHEDINRSEPRRKAYLHAFATDLDDTTEVKCLVVEVSRKGCRLSSSQVHKLPRVIRIFVQGLAEPIRGVIIWRRRNMAGVLFEHGCDGRLREHIQAAADASDENSDVMTLGTPVAPASFSDRLSKIREKAAQP